MNINPFNPSKRKLDSYIDSCIDYYLDSYMDMKVALWSGKLDKVWTFVKTGEKIPGLSGDDSNLRMIIEKCPDPELIELVLDSMTIEEINYGPPKMCTALGQAAETYNAPVVKLLLKAKANVNLAPLNRITPLHGVAIFQNPDIEKQCKEATFQMAVQTAQLLIQAGAIIDCRNCNGRTPLGECVGASEDFINTDLITLLVSEGAAVPNWMLLYKEPTLLSKINLAVQNGLQMRQQEVTQALTLQLPGPIGSLIAEYV